MTALEGVYREGKAPLLVARGYDHAHRLSRGRSSATFQNVKYSDIARTIASQVGLGVGTIDDSGRVHDHVGQTGQTDWEFLRSLAREVGFEVAVVEGKLEFRRPRRGGRGARGRATSARSDPLQLVFGQDLLDFRPRVTSSGQVSRVEVRGWDPATKQAIVGTAQARSTAAQLADDPGSLAGRFGSPVLVVEGGFPSQAEADRAAEALAEQVGSAFAEASGIARGNPRAQGRRGRERLAGRRAVRRALHAHPHAPHVRSPGRLPDPLHRERPPGPLAHGPRRGRRRPAARAVAAVAEVAPAEPETARLRAWSWGS